MSDFNLLFGVYNVGHCWRSRRFGCACCCKFTHEYGTQEAWILWRSCKEFASAIGKVHNLCSHSRLDPMSYHLNWCVLLHIEIHVEDKIVCSSKDSSLKDLQELAARLFTKGKTMPEEMQNANSETDNKKKQPNKELNSNSNLSPLARFLLSRLVKWLSLRLLCFDFRVLIILSKLILRHLSPENKRLRQPIKC